MGDYFGFSPNRGKLAMLFVSLIGSANSLLLLASKAITTIHVSINRLKD